MPGTDSHTNPFFFNGTIIEVTTADIEVQGRDLELAIARSSPRARVELPNYPITKLQNPLARAPAPHGNPYLL